MTCKDCIHNKICSTYIQVGDDGEVCPYFADESQYIKLPCNVGDVMYTNFAVVGDYLRAKDNLYACKVVFVGINANAEFGGGFINVEYINGRMWQFNFADIGKTVFLTKESAEKALREREEK